MQPSRRHFDDLINDLREAVMRMGSIAEQMVQDAVEALIKRDTVAGRAIADRDSEVDRMELEVQSTVMVLIAREQPVAHDLRFLASALSVAIELERIADDAVSIAKKAITIDSDVAPQDARDLLEMSDKVRTMLLNSLRAFAAEDQALLDAVIVADNDVDQIWKRVRRRIKDEMRADADRIDSAFKLLQAFHHLEYVGDHAVSIAERLEFVRTGNLVRFSRAK
jgi:phosphate transport system protein